MATGALDERAATHPEGILCTARVSDVPSPASPEALTPDSDLRSLLARSLSPRALLRSEQNSDWRITGRWMLYSVVVGVAGALGAIVGFVRQGQVIGEYYRVYLKRQQETV